MCAAICGNGVVEAGEQCDQSPPDSTNCGTDVGECTIGTQTRTCKASTCQWNLYGSCSDVKPVAEVCDSKDNNCDGSTDEGGICSLCGNGFCGYGESCEWGGATQMLCDGLRSTIPSGGTCSNCVYTPAASTCGNGICSYGESCEWYSAGSRQMLCDGLSSVIPLGVSCSACKINPGSKTYIIRQRIGVNQFIDPDAASHPERQDTLAAFQQELNDPKFTVFRITFNDYIKQTIPNDVKVAVQDAVSRNKLVIIAFQTFVHTPEAYDQTSEFLNTLLADVEPKENIIVNVMNEDDVYDHFGTWTSCPPISPLRINPSSPASQTYLNELKIRVSIARANMDPRIRFMANPAWYYDHQYLIACPGWESIPVETWSMALVRYHAFLDAFDEYLDVLGLNYYPEGTDSTVVNVVNSLKQRYGMPVIITETGKGSGATENDALRKQLLVQEFAALNNQVDIPAIIVYYDREDAGYGVKNKDGSLKGSYSAIPSNKDIYTTSKPSWCIKTYVEGGFTVCDIAYQ